MRRKPSKVRPAFGYVRVSSNGQLKGDGPERQREAILAYAEEHGIEVVGWYEEAYTGTAGDRTELNNLIYDVKENNAVTVVIIESLDRLARDVMVQELIVRDLRKLDIDLISTQEGPDLATTDKTRKFIRQIMGAVAEYEKDNLVERLRVARQRKKKVLGHASGPLPFYTRELAKRIRRMNNPPRGKKMTFARIAEVLNEEGVPTRHKKPWTAALAHSIAKKDYPRRKKEKS